MRFKGAALALALVLTAALCGVYDGGPAQADASYCPVAPASLDSQFLDDPVWWLYPPASYAPATDDMANTAPVGSELVEHGPTPGFGDPTATVVAQWSVNGIAESGVDAVDSSGDDEPAYFPQAEDVGQLLRLTFTATDAGCSPVSVTSNSVAVTTGTLVPPARTAPRGQVTTKYGTAWTTLGTVLKQPEIGSWRLPDRAGVLTPVDPSLLSTTRRWKKVVPKTFVKGVGMTYSEDALPDATAQSLTPRRSDEITYGVAQTATASYDADAATGSWTSLPARLGTPVRARVTTDLTLPHRREPGMRHWLQGTTVTVRITPSLREFDWEHPTLLQGIDQGLDSRRYVSLELVRSGGKPVGEVRIARTSWHHHGGATVATARLSANKAEYVPAGNQRIWVKPLYDYAAEQVGYDQGWPTDGASWNTIGRITLIPASAKMRWKVSP